MGLPNDMDMRRAEEIIGALQEGVFQNAPAWREVDMALYRYAIHKGILRADISILDKPRAFEAFVANMADYESVAMAELRNILAQRIAVGESFGEAHDETALPGQFLKALEALERQDAQRVRA